MTNESAARNDEKARAEALFRYRVIATLLDAGETASLRMRVDALASQSHVHPLHGERKVTVRTLWTWLARFRAGGIEALRPRHRKDKGSTRGLPLATLDRAEVLRRELPTRWTSTVLDILIREGTLTSAEAPRSRDARSLPAQPWGFSPTTRRPRREAHHQDAL